MIWVLSKAICVYDQALESANLALATATATKLLERLFPGLGEKIRLANQSPEAPKQEKRLLSWRHATDDWLLKRRRYGFECPPDFLEMEEKVNRRLAAEAEDSAALSQNDPKI